MLLLFAFFQQKLRVLYGFLILKQSHSAIFPPEKDSFQPPFLRRFLKCGNQLPNLPKQVSDGELKASGPSGPHFLVMGHHAGPMGITRIQLTSSFESTNRQREESAASAGHGSLAICLLELLAAGIYWFEIYRRQRWWTCCIVRSWFSWLSPVFHEGCAEIPYRCCPTFLMIFTITVLAGWTEGDSPWLFCLFPKNMTWIYPPASNSGKKRSRLRFLAKDVGCSRVVTSASILETGETNQRRLSKVKPIRQTSRSFYEVGGFSDHLADAKGTYLSSKWWFLLSMNFDPISFIF